MKTPSKTKTYSKKKTHLKSVVFDCLFKARYKSIRFSREYSFFDATTHLVPCKFHAGKFLSQHFCRLLWPFSHHLFPNFLPNLFHSFSAMQISCWKIPFSTFLSPITTFFSPSFSQLFAQPFRQIASQFFSWLSSHLFARLFSRLFSWFFPLLITYIKSSFLSWSA